MPLITPAPPRVDLVRDVLDKQLVDPDGEPLGKVDGLILELHPDGRPPTVRAIETGLPPLARRLPSPVERFLRFCARHVGIRRGRPTRIRWSRVTAIDRDVRVRLEAQRSPTTAWDRWLRTHFTSRIPKSG